MEGVRGTPECTALGTFSKACLQNLILHERMSYTLTHPNAIRKKHKAPRVHGTVRLELFRDVMRSASLLRMSESCSSAHVLSCWTRFALKAAVL